MYALCINTIILGPCIQRFAQEVAPELGNHRGKRLYNHSGNHSCSLVQCDLMSWEWVPGLEGHSPYSIVAHPREICMYGLKLPLYKLRQELPHLFVNHLTTI